MGLWPAVMGIEMQRVYGEDISPASCTRNAQVGFDHSLHLFLAASPKGGDLWPHHCNVSGNPSQPFRYPLLD